MKTWCVATVVALLAPSIGEACPIKNNDVSIVLGVAGGEVVTLQLALHEREREPEMAGEWVGTATLVVGDAVTHIGRIDPAGDPALEIDRLTALGRDRAKRLAGFAAAAQVEQIDCSEAPGVRCGIARLAKTTLHVGGARVEVAEEQRIVGVVRYRAGETEIAVVNVGVGDPRFTSAVRPCTAQGCLQIATLHHGEQRDYVIVTRRGA